MTLVEVVAVILVLAILAGTAAPAINSMSATRTVSAARHLQEDLSWARQRAAATGTPVWIVLDVGDDAWTILAEDPQSPGFASAEPVTDPATGRPFVIRLGEIGFAGVNISVVDIDGGTAVGFDWLGRPLNQDEDPLASAAQITFTGGANSRSVTIEPETGAAR